MICGGVNSYIITTNTHTLTITMDHTDTSPTVTDNTTVMNNTAVTDTSSTVTDNTTVVTITDEKKKVPQQQKSITQVINKRIYYYDEYEYQTLFDLAGIMD